MRHIPGLADALNDVLPLRQCVGVMLLNREGKVWVGKRKPKFHVREPQAPASPPPPPPAAP